MKFNNNALPVKLMLLFCGGGVVAANSRSSSSIDFVGELVERLEKLENERRNDRALIDELKEENEKLWKGLQLEQEKYDDHHRLIRPTAGGAAKKNNAKKRGAKKIKHRVSANEEAIEALWKCNPKCRDPCSLPMDVGPCVAIVPRFYYNQETSQCEKFDWGGCGGNTNNFETLVECEKKCEKLVCPTDLKTCKDGKTKVGQNLYNDCEFDPCPEDICLLLIDAGPCGAATPRYYYNAGTGQCEKFTYGGCLGNKNNFLKLEECQTLCEEPIIVCAKELMTCPDGKTKVGRDPYNDCEYFPCPKCCDPLTEPGLPGNHICREGHACCPDTGEWVCSIGDAKRFFCGDKLTSGPFGKACEKLVCCNPKQMPLCFDGTAECCPGGKWSCPKGESNIFLCGEPPAETVGPLMGERCSDKCCDPLTEPGMGDNNVCREGHACCLDTGEWVCSIGDGKTFFCGSKLTTGPFGKACEKLA